MALKLLVYFDGRFWVGLVERTGDGVLTISRMVFGRFPTDPEISGFVLGKLDSLPESPPLPHEKKLLQDSNPQRLHRLARKEAKSSGPVSKSREAIKKMEEERLALHQTSRRKRREDDREFKFRLKSLKRKNKRKGR